MSAEMNHSALEGKHILFLGSSVTYGSGANGVSFAEFLAETYGVCSIKEAVSGTTLVDNGPDSYIARMKAMPDPGKIDLFVCQLSTNDATRGEPLGTISEDFAPESFDTRTVAGAIEYIIAWAGRTYGCPVVFYTNPKYDSPAYAAMVDLLLKIQKKWPIGLVDLWNDAAFNDIAPETRKAFMADPIHPTRRGYLEWWMPKFAEILETILR